MSEKKALKGAEFLIRESEPEDIFIPEEFDEEQQMIAQTCVDFLEQEVYPHLEGDRRHERGPDVLHHGKSG